MARTCINVTGDMAGAVVIAASEGELRDPRELEEAKGA